MTNLTVLDDVLSDEQIQFIRDSSLLQDNLANMNEYGYQLQWDEIEPFHPIINIINKYWDLSDVVAYELWQQLNDRPPHWHYDRDEICAEKGITKYPVMTSVYYLDVHDVVDGRLFFEDDTHIEPVQNRLVMFGPAVEHYVERFSGHRHSIVINPWNSFLGDYD